MSGIAGILRRDGQPIKESWVAKLENSLQGRLWRFEDSVELSEGSAELLFISDTKMSDNCVIGNESTSVLWNKETLELFFARNGIGNHQLYVLNLGKAGDGVVFCSNPMPLLHIASELELQATNLLNATQQFLQLGFVTGNESLLSPVLSVPLEIDLAFSSCNQTESEIERSSSVAEDLISLVSRIGLPFSDYTLLSKLWKYRNASSKGKSTCDGFENSSVRIKESVKLSRWQGMLSQLPKQTKARDWAMFGITTFDSIFSIARIEQLTSHPFDSPFNPQYIGSIEEQLKQYDNEVRNPDSVFRGMDAAADLAQVELEICDECANPIESFPLSSWLRSPQSSLGQLAGDTFSSKDPFGNLPIDNSVVLKLFSAHNQETKDYSKELFALLTLSLWSAQVHA
ncbi:MAG TPA: hypothetical protein EYO40_04450 [Phycisphaerales bacterium]|nr:hypothetical protein [Phycisphaerales bacterium]HIB50514.1 hypothetical protein [Phycisphaerales bacterium]HIN84693.1 hypothetical protein [Phycisphaerales bacterium]HIO19737.1 hypothetical protein [Phycisphaerales bacterium]HIO52255.1 hypothetical protein [Phycisphaerales bacterium]